VDPLTILPFALLCAKRKTSFKELIKFSVTIMIVDLFQYFSFTCLIA